MKARVMNFSVHFKLQSGQINSVIENEGDVGKKDLAVDMTSCNWPHKVDKGSNRLLREYISSSCAT